MKIHHKIAETAEQNEKIAEKIAEIAEKIAEIAEKIAEITEKIAYVKTAFVDDYEQQQRSLNMRQFLDVAALLGHVKGKPGIPLADEIAHPVPPKRKYVDGFMKLDASERKSQAGWEDNDLKEVEEIYNAHSEEIFAITPRELKRLAFKRKSNSKKKMTDEINKAVEEAVEEAVKRCKMMI